MYSTRTRVHARIPSGHPREEKRACRTSRRISRRGSSCISGSWQAERGTTSARPRHADIRARILSRKSAMMSVSVSLSLSVSVPWNSSYTKLTTHQTATCDAVSARFGPSVRGQIHLFATSQSISQLLAELIVDLFSFQVYWNESRLRS